MLIVSKMDFPNEAIVVTLETYVMVGLVCLKGEFDDVTTYLNIFATFRNRQHTNIVMVLQCGRSIVDFLTKFILNIRTPNSLSYCF